MNINQNYLNRAAKIESESETVFQKVLKAINWKFLAKSSQEQDMFDHIDCFVSDSNGKKYSVDIKGLKRQAIGGRILIELQNVCGNRGWLFGKADLIAFQIDEEDFVFVERSKLFGLVKSLCGFDVMVKGNFNVVMKGIKCANVDQCNAPNWYARSDRPKEKVTFIPFEEILKIKLTLVG